METALVPLKPAEHYRQLADIGHEQARKKYRDTTEQKVWLDDVLVGRLSLSVEGYALITWTNWTLPIWKVEVLVDLLKNNSAVQLLHTIIAAAEEAFISQTLSDHFGVHTISRGYHNYLAADAGGPVSMFVHV